MSISCRVSIVFVRRVLVRKWYPKTDIPGSTAFVPSVAGLIIAGEVIKDSIGFDTANR